MPDRIDRSAENKIFKKLMAVSAHYQEVGLKFFDHCRDPCPRVSESYLYLDVVTFFIKLALVVLQCSSIPGRLLILNITSINHSACGLDDVQQKIAGIQSALGYRTSDGFIIHLAEVDRNGYTMVG